MRRILTVASIIGAAVVFAGDSVAQENQNATKPAETITPDQVAKFVEQLDSDEFAKRTKAVERLTQAGKIAIPALAAAAESDSIEKRFRAMKILGELYGSEDEATHQATAKALAKLRESKIRGTARVAKRLLDKPNYEIPDGIWRGTGRVNGFQGGLVIKGANGVRITGGQVQIGGDSQIVVTKVADGLRTVDIFQGTGLGILILDGANRQGIEIHLRTLKNNEETFQRVQVKNAAELAKKHPMVNDLYKKYENFQKTRTTIQGGVN